jgi:hypothetical protein
MKNESPRPIAVPSRTAITPLFKRLSSPKSGSASRKTSGLRGLDTKKIVKICLPDSASEREGGPQERALLPACYYDSTTVIAREALALVFVDKDLAPRTIPERIFARKPCTSACERRPVCYLASDRVFRPAGAAGKSCRPKSRGRPPRNQGKRTFGEPSRPEPVVPQGQGRGPQRGRVPGEPSN